MKTSALPHKRAYLARLAIDTGATLIAIGRTRSEAMRRAIAAIEPVFAHEYEAAEIAQHTDLRIENESR